MGNKFRNEMELKLGSTSILLRPSFENIAAMEANVGSVMWLVWKFSRGMKFTNGKPDGFSVEASVKSMPGVAEISQIIFYNQAATKPENPTLKQFNLEEVFDLVMEAGINSVMPKVLEYLGQVATGGAGKKDEEPTELEKKSGP